jgi:hypothetical protein
VGGARVLEHVGNQRAAGVLGEQKGAQERLRTWKVSPPPRRAPDTSALRGS